MTHPSPIILFRVFRFTPAVAVLAIVLGCFPVAAAPPPARSPEIRPLALLPGSAEFVISVDYFTLRKSDLVAELESRFDALPEAADNYRQFVQQTGLDPRQDTDQVVMALRHVGEGAQGDFLMIAQGRFGPSRLLDLAAEKGGTLSSPKEGMRVWTSRPKPGAQRTAPQGPSDFAMAQPDASTLIFGAEKEVLRVVDVLQGARPPEVKEARLKDLLAGVDRKAPFWAIVNSSSLAQHLSTEIGQGNPDWKPGAALSSVDSVRISAWVGKDVDLKLEVQAKDRESAGLLGDMIRGALAAGKLAAKDRDPELLKSLQETTITEDGTGIAIKAHIPGSRLHLADPGSSSSN